MTRRVGRVQVVDVTRRDERQLLPAGEPGEPAEGRLLDLHADVLQLDVRRVATEDLREPVELGLGVGLAMLAERARDASGQAAGERDQTGGVALEQLPVDTRLVVVALEVPERAEFDEVAVAALSAASSVRWACPFVCARRSSTTYTSQPKIGLIPCCAAALCRSTAPAIEPWSVSVTAGISSSAAFRASAGILHAPSRIEYSEWTCRWTNGALTGRPSYCPHWTFPDRAETHERLGVGHHARTANRAWRWAASFAPRPPQDTRQMRRIRR